MNPSIFIFLFILTISFYLYKKYSNVNIPSDINIDYTSNIKDAPTLQCGVLNPLTIVNCTNNSQCDQCQCSNKSSLSGCMTCQVINNDNNSTSTLFSTIPKSDCTYPYVWDDKNNVCKLSNGTYCLPTVIQDVYCNPYTTKKVLTKTEDGYQWKCICNGTEFNQTPNSGQDCNHMMLCGMEGSTTNPSNFQRGIYHLDKNGLPYTCINDDDCNVDGFSGDKCSEGKCFWQPGSATSKGSNWNPLDNYKNSAGASTSRPAAACKCGPDETAGPNMTCIPNKCPGGLQKCVDSNGQSAARVNGECPIGYKPSDTECECPKGKFIDCRDIGTSRTDTQPPISYYNGICTIPSCVPDPCGENGTFDVTTRNCICKPGYTNVVAPHSLIGQTCVNLCDDIHNPCGPDDPTNGFKRGDCFVDSVNQLNLLFDESMM